MSTSYAKANNILLVAITRLGDLLQASPTIIGLKEENPNAKITVAVDRQFSAICKGIPGIDEVYEMDLSLICRSLQLEGASIVDAYTYVSNVVEELKARNFDYCLNMSSSGYTALLLKMLGIKESRGWISDDEGYRLISNPWAMLFAAFVFHSNRDYNSINLVDIVRCSAGVTKHPTSLRYEVSDNAIKSAHGFLKSHGIETGGPLICLQAGASQEKRQWEARKFARLLDFLTSELNARVILTGSKSEQLLTEEILKYYNHKNIISAVGQTNLDELSAILKCADILITGDTGPMHLAVAVGTPVVAIFLASALAFETGPYSSGNFVIQPQLSCHPCNPNFPCSRPDCHDQVTPELVHYVTKLRLNTPSGQEGDITISPEVANPSEVMVYRTTFDEDEFLQFEPMISTSSVMRNGHSIEYFEAARNAYRKLWKEEFGAVAEKEIPERPGNKEINSKLASIDTVSEVYSALEMVTEHAHEGIKLLEELCTLIRDVQSSPKRLGEVNNCIQENSRDIEDLGLSCPILGALIRMFIMENQNVRGEDPLFIASQMKGLYETLTRRSEKFTKFFAHLT